jgi:hypothetical protein
MRLPGFLFLSVVTSGCSIHVVQQPATPPVLVAEAHRPSRPRHVTYERVAVVPTPAPPRSHAPSVVMPARPSRVPHRMVAPEARNGRPARPAHIAVPAPPRREKVKRHEPLAEVSSAGVAKAQ